MNLNPVIACWSAKGGTGTSAFAATLALCLARSTETVLVDAAGDQHSIFGVEGPPVGFCQWAAGGDGVPAAALSRLAIEVAPWLALVPSGEIESPGTHDSLVVRMRDAFPASCIVVDAGTLRTSADAFAQIVIDADHSFAVVRPCYLAAERVLKCEVPRDGIVVVEEPGRVLTTRDMRGVLGNVSATFHFDPAIARAVDAGRLVRHLPRSTKSIEKLASELLAGEVQRAS